MFAWHDSTVSPIFSTPWALSNSIHSMNLKLLSSRWFRLLEQTAIPDFSPFSFLNNQVSRDGFINTHTFDNEFWDYSWQFQFLDTQTGAMRQRPVSCPPWPPGPCSWRGRRPRGSPCPRHEGSPLMGSQPPPPHSLGWPQGLRSHCTKCGKMASSQDNLWI